MNKFFSRLETVIASVAWQSFKLALETFRLTRRFTPLNDYTLSYD